MRKLVVTLAVLLLILAVVLILRPAAPYATETADEIAPTVVLVSIDGFRADYLDRYPAPTLQRLAEEGVRAERMIPAFPSKTFPNHYTLVTGLYPAQHGIIANNMYDPGMDASFSLGNRQAIADARWWGGEPLWVTAEQQGQTSATYFWPGSEAAIQGVRPTHWKAYDGSVPGTDRVDEVLAWLDLPADERPTFITLYFSDVDGAGHDHGPDADEVRQAVARVDGYLDRLVAGLEARGLLDAVHLIVTSDHGMAPLSADRVIYLDDYVDLDDVQVIDWSPVLMAAPADGDVEALFEALQGTHPNWTVYREGELPDRFHFAGHPRIPPVVAIADEGWTITTRARAERRPVSGGTHGYDPELPSMGALFVARGPSFTPGTELAPFESVHLYPLMAHVLGLNPAPNAGSLDVLRPLLREAVTP